MSHHAGSELAAIPHDDIRWHKHREAGQRPVPQPGHVRASKTARANPCAAPKSVSASEGMTSQSRYARDLPLHPSAGWAMGPDDSVE
jgi:hypothetical protein